MKKISVLLLCLSVLFFIGCSQSENQQAPPPPPSAENDAAHLTAESNGFKLSVSRELRSMSQLIKSTKSGYDVVSILVKVENNTKNNIPVAPDFITLKMSDGTVYKYSSELTDNGPLGKSAFVKRTIPPDYNGGGLLLFELKPGSIAQTLNYKDNSGHDMTIKFPAGSKASI